MSDYDDYVIWSDGFYRKVIKRPTPRGTKYNIIFCGEDIEIYDDDMLDMCRTVLKDFEESEAE